MKKLLFTLSMTVYLALFILISYVVTTICLETNTSNSLWFMGVYYLIFGAYVIGFIRNSIKSFKKKPEFDRIYITKEGLLKGLGIAIYLGAFAFASYILIRMRMNNLPVFKWFIAYIVVFVLPCLNFIDEEMIRVHCDIYSSSFGSTLEYWRHLNRMHEYIRINEERERGRRNTSRPICYDNEERETEDERLQRESDEWYAYEYSRKQFEEIGNNHRW